MLHIVQVVLSGCAEVPQVFCKEAAAHAAFVECAKKYWAQSYTAYCERNGVSSENFSSAQGFVAGFDLADRSRIHYWSVAPEDAGAADISRLLPGAAELAERRERILRLAREVEESSGTVREGLAELMDAIAGLGGESTGKAEPPAPSLPGRLAAVELPASPASQEAPQLSTGKYDARERKAYVESIKGMLCGGNRGEFPLFNRYDWRQAVYSNETGFEYWEWVGVKIHETIEKAQSAGYSVVDDPDQSGCYRFRTPDGVVSEISCEAEGEAWCRAGLHLEGK